MNCLIPSLWAWGRAPHLNLITGCLATESQSINAIPRMGRTDLQNAQPKELRFLCFGLLDDSVSNRPRLWSITELRQQTLCLWNLVRSGHRLMMVNTLVLQTSVWDPLICKWHNCSIKLISGGWEKSSNLSAMVANRISLSWSDQSHNDGRGRQKK